MTQLDKTKEMLIIQEYLRRYAFFEDATITYPDLPDCVFENGEAKDG